MTGLDLARGCSRRRARARRGRPEVEFIEGDAEELPFEDGTFDAVTSCFGVMFAPRQPIAAAELVRVARPGAKVVFAAWTPRA